MTPKNPANRQQQGIISEIFSGRLILFGFMLAGFFSVIAYFNLLPLAEQQYVFLADAFTKGRLYFLQMPQTWSDASLFGGRYYWPLGALPALLLAPFVFAADCLGHFFYQGYMNLALVTLIFVSAYRIAKLEKYSARDSLMLAYAFCFSSMFLGVALMSFSWQLAQAVSAALMLLAVREYLGKKRWTLIGLLMGLVAASRITAGIGIIFFILDIAFSGGGLRQKMKTLAKLCAPFAIIVALIFTYNHLRFGNFLEAGYTYQVLFDATAQSRDVGLFSLSHLARNLKASLINMPQYSQAGGSGLIKLPGLAGNPWGMSIFLTSPYLFWLFFWRRYDKTSLFLVFSIAAVFLALALSFGTGYKQFGYRYGLDFFPLLYLLFISNYYKKNKGLSPLMRTLIYISSIFNLYLFFTIY